MKNHEIIGLIGKLVDPSVPVKNDKYALDLAEETKDFEIYKLVFEMFRGNAKVSENSTVHPANRDFFAKILKLHQDSEKFKIPKKEPTVIFNVIQGLPTKRPNRLKIINKY